MGGSLIARGAPIAEGDLNARRTLFYKIDSRKGKELEFCTRGMVLAFFILINVNAFEAYLEMHKVK